MAESSWPSPSNGRAVNDLQYEQLARSYLADGLIGLPTDPSLVYADSTGRQVKVRANRFAALGGHEWTSGPTEFTKAVDPFTSSGNSRLDLAVLGLNRSTWDVTCYVKKGTPASTPVAPALQQDTGSTGIYEIPLARIGPLASGFTTVTAGDVTPLAWYLGEQKILCKSTTRPPHKLGREISESDTGKRYWSDGASWIRITDERNGLGEIGPYAATFNGATHFEQLDILLVPAVPVIPGHFYNLHAFGLIYSSSDNTAGQGVLIMNSDSVQLGFHALPPANFGHTASLHMLGWQAPAGSTTAVLKLRAGKLNGAGPVNLSNWRVSVVHTGLGAVGI